MPFGSGLSTRPERYNSESVLNESWRQFYDIDGHSVGRGGAGKVFRIKPKSVNILCERKTDMPVNLSEGQFGPLFELLNEIPYEKPLAVKIIRRFRGGRDSINKIRNEINLIKMLRPSENDPSFPRAVAPLLYSVHEDLTQVAIVMEFAQGGSLFDLCSPETFKRSPLPSGDGGLPSVPTSISKPHIPETYISSVLLRVTDALAFMHGKANIVHLDIKAENILLREPYPSSDVFITDFGLASFLSSTKPHRELAGTPDYTAPEVISYDPVSFATDMWSLGVLAYFMLTGVSPFLAESKALTLSNITQMKIDYPPELFDSVSAPALAFIRALIQRNPRDRLTAIQCCQHEWLREHAEKDRLDEAKIDVVEAALVEDVCAANSGDDESISSASSSSAFSSPSRKRIALDDAENVETFRQVSLKPPTNLAPISPIGVSVTACCVGLLSARPIFSLEGGISRHHRQSRRRPVLASISSPATVAEVISPVD